MEEKYILIKWPYSQEIMEHPRFDECYLLQAFDHQIQYDAAYFVPQDLYRELKDELQDV